MNKQTSHSKQKGFTLIEMLLVMVIIGVIVYASIGYIQQRTRQLGIDKTTIQMQQVLNAGMSYYVANGTWPASVDCLQGSGGASCTVTYLPTPFVNAYALPFTIATQPSSPTLTVETTIQAGIATPAVANSIAGLLPAGQATNQLILNGNGSGPCTSQSACYVNATVQLPGQNLNNASAVNFAGLYHHGGCVPVPVCPTGTTPQIMAVPASVSGVNDSPTQGGPVYAYPITSFTAYAVSDTPNGTPKGTSPPLCGTSMSPPGNATDCTQGANSGTLAKAYWRVCLQVITEKGNVATTSAGGAFWLGWGQYVTLLAITRCSITNEAAGSPFVVFGN